MKPPRKRQRQAQRGTIRPDDHRFATRDHNEDLELCPQILLSGGLIGNRTHLSQENSHPDSEGSSRVIEEQSEGYEYTADVRAWETFRNILRGHGVNLREGDRKVTFTSERRLDMKGMKERGLLWSYAVAKVKRVKLLEEVG